MYAFMGRFCLYRHRWLVRTLYAGLWRCNRKNRRW